MVVVDHCGGWCDNILHPQEPSVEHLREALHTLVSEQQELYQKAAHSALSLGRLNQRLVIMERYFLAMVRKGALPEPAEGEEGEGQGEELEEVENGAAEEEREGGGVAKSSESEGGGGGGGKKERKVEPVGIEKLTSTTAR